MCSPSKTLGVAVRIDLNSPRISLGAPGFGSHVSSWLWPPLANTRMTDLARPKPGNDRTDAPAAAAGTRGTPRLRPAKALSLSHARRPIGRAAARVSIGSLQSTILNGQERGADKPYRPLLAAHCRCNASPVHLERR